MAKPIIRSLLVVLGTLLLMLSSNWFRYADSDNIVPIVTIHLFAIAMLMTGCLIWVSLKHCHLAWALCGLLGPIGLIVLWALPDKNKVNS